MKSYDLNDLEKKQSPLPAEGSAGADAEEVMKEIERLLKQLEDENFDVRYGAAYVIGKLAAELSAEQKKELISRLVERLGDKDDHVRDGAVRAIGKLAASGSLSDLSAEQKNQIIGKLLENLGDKDLRVRLEVAEAIGNMAAELNAEQKSEIMSRLVERLGDKDDDVKDGAVGVISKLSVELGAKQKNELVSLLLEKLGDEDSDVRGAAAKAISKLAPGSLSDLSAEQQDKIARLLVEILGHNDILVRLEAADAIGNMAAELNAEQKSEIMSRLVERLGDKDSDVRSGVPEAIGKLASELSTEQKNELVSRLVERLGDKDSDVRSGAAEAIGNMAESGTLSDLSAEQKNEIISRSAEKLGDKDWRVRSGTAEAIGNMAVSGGLSDLSAEQKKEVLGRLVERLGDKESYVKSRATEAIGKLAASGSLSDLSAEQKSGVISLLLEKLGDEDDRVRSGVAEAIGKLAASGSLSDLSAEQKKEVLGRLLEMLGDKDDHVRKRAAEAIGNMAVSGALSDLSAEQKNKVLGLLLEKLGDGYSWAMRNEAAEAIGNLSVELSAKQKNELVNRLVEKLGDKDHHVRKRAAEAIGNLSVELSAKQKNELVSLLSEKLGDEDSHVREGAMQAISSMAVELSTEQKNELVSRLVERLGDKIVPVRYGAAEAICKMAVELSTEQKGELVSRLVERLGDKIVHVRYGAAYAIDILAESGVIEAGLYSDLQELQQILDTLRKGKSMDDSGFKGLALKLAQDHKISIDKIAQKLGNIKFARQLKKEQNYAKIIKLEMSSEQRTMNRDLQEKLLEDQIKSISKEDVLLSLKHRIFELLGAIPVQQKGIEAWELKELLKECDYPEQLIIHQEQGFFSSAYYALIKTHDPFVQIINLLQKIQNIKSELSKYGNVYASVESNLDAIVDYYNDYIEELQNASDEEQAKYYSSKTLLQSRDMYRYVDEDIAKELIGERDDYGELKMDAEQHGSHAVRILNGVYYKSRPHAPGVEFTVDSLNKLIGGYISAPTRLVSLRQGEYHYPFLASRGVIGTELQYVLEQRPEYIKRLDSRNFADMMILSLLTDPNDAKPDNYLVEYNLGRDDQKGFESKDAPTGNVESFRIIGIDNDIAFADPFFVIPGGKEKGKHFINIKNVLYFFPQMDDRIDPGFREYFLSQVPELLVAEWMGELIRQNKIYNHMLLSGVFSEQDYSGDPRNDNDLGMQLPIRFKAGTVRTIYHKLQLMEQYMLENENLTYRSLFLKVERLVARYYQELEQKVKTSFGDYSDQDMGDIIMECIYELYKPNALLLEDMLPLEMAKERGDMGKMTQLVLKTAKKYAFENDRNQDLVKAGEEFIAAIDFSRFSSDSRVEEILWTRFVENFTSIESLSINGSEYLDDNSLYKLVRRFPNLEEVILSNIDKITLDGAKLVMKSLVSNKVVSGKQKLVVEDCKYLGKDSWDGLLQEDMEFYIRVGNHEINMHQNPARIFGELLEQGLYSKELYDYLRISKNIDMDAKYSEWSGMNVLHRAVCSGNTKIVDYILKHGDRDAYLSSDDYKYTALHYAARGGHVNIVRLLFKHIGSEDSIRQYVSMKDKRGEDAICKAIKKGHAEVLRCMHFEYGIEIEGVKDTKMLELLADMQSRYSQVEKQGDVLESRKELATDEIVNLKILRERKIWVSKRAMKIITGDTDEEKADEQVSYKEMMDEIAQLKEMLKQTKENYNEIESIKRRISQQGKELVKHDSRMLKMEENILKISELESKVDRLDKQFSSLDFTKIGENIDEINKEIEILRGSDLGDLKHRLLSLEESRDQIMQRVGALAHKFDVTGITDKEAIVARIEELKSKNDKLYEYFKILYFEFESYLQVYSNLSTGLITGKNFEDLQKASNKSNSIFAYLGSAGWKAVSYVMGQYTITSAIYSVAENMGERRDAAELKNQVTRITKLMQNKLLQDGELDKNEIAQIVLKFTEIRAELISSSTGAEQKQTSIGVVSKIQNLIEKAGNGFIKIVSRYDAAEGKLAANDALLLLGWMHSRYNGIMDLDIKLSEFLDEITVREIEVGCIMCDELLKIKDKSIKGKWESSKKRLGGVEKNIEGRLKDQYIKEKLGDDMSSPENIKMAKMLYFAMINMGAMESRKEGAMKCVGKFKDSEPDLFNEIAACCPKYFVGNVKATELIDDIDLRQQVIEQIKEGTTIIYALHSIEYDHKLLNPSVFGELIKFYSIDELVALSSKIDESIVSHAGQTGDYTALMSGLSTLASDVAEDMTG